MIHRIWRLSEYSDDNLGVSCTADGLLLGRTPLIERRAGKFLVRDRSEIARLLGRAYLADPPLDRIMGGLGNVAAALDANDRCLAHIAAVHMRMPDLADSTARQRMEAEDSLIKYARDDGGDDSWNPALHPRAGSPPNPGWFAPTDGSESESSPARTAQNENPKQSSDAAPNSSDSWIRLPRAKRNDELGDLAEWIANAKPEDEKQIRAEIKRLFYDVGDTRGGDALDGALSDVLQPGISTKARHDILDYLDHFTRGDPADQGFLREWLPQLILLFFGAIPKRPVELGPTAEIPLKALRAQIWKYGWAKRGQIIDAVFRDGSLPPNFAVIDNFTNGVAESIKSINLNAATYQNVRSLIYRLSDYLEKLGQYEGGEMKDTQVKLADIVVRKLKLIIPEGSMTTVQRDIIETVRAMARSAYRYPVEIEIVPF